MQRPEMKIFHNSNHFRTAFLYTLNAQAERLLDTQEFNSFLIY